MWKFGTSVNNVQVKKTSYFNDEDKLGLHCSRLIKCHEIESFSTNYPR